MRGHSGDVGRGRGKGMDAGAETADAAVTRAMVEDPSGNAKIGFTVQNGITEGPDGSSGNRIYEERENCNTRFSADDSDLTGPQNKATGLSSADADAWRVTSDNAATNPVTDTIAQQKTGVNSKKEPLTKSQQLRVWIKTLPEGIRKAAKTLIHPTSV